MADCTITILAENTAGGRGLLAEHGLAYWIELGGRRILFDTGQGLVLGHNARRLGIALESVEHIVLSHGHYDHTGGLSDVLAQGNNPKVFIHADAFMPKYSRNPDGTGRDVGMSDALKQAVRAEPGLHWVEGPTPITEGLWCTGPIPRTNDYEDTGGAFFNDASCRQADEIRDDQAIFLETKSGTVVISGCAHAGIVNTLHYILTLTDHRPIHAVVGGMHLLHASPRRMETTIAELRRLNIQRLMPCHCTGFAAMARLWNELPDQYESIVTGAVIRFER